MVADQLRAAMRAYPTGVTVVAGLDADGAPAGLAVNSFTSVSLEPPLVLFCPAHNSRSWPRIARAGAYAINILSANDAPLCALFASRVEDKFASVVWRPGRTGAPVIDSALTALECEPVQVHPAGDHDIVVGRVVAVSEPRDVEPLVYYRGGYAGLRPLQEGDGS